MNDDSIGGIVVVIIFCILAFGLGSLAGSFHIAEDISQEIIPSSLTTSAGSIKPINEGNFTSENVTLTYPKKTVTYTKTKTTNTTNDTNSTNSTSTGNSTYHGNYGNSNHSGSNNNHNHSYNHNRTY